MRLKGIKAIEKEINKFLLPFGCSCIFGTEFAYYYQMNKIEVAFVVDETANKEFLQSIEKFNPLVSMDIFLWSLLHEVGHHETYDSLTEEEILSDQDIKDLILAKKIDRLEYYNCNDELSATNWAVKYANTHIKELTDFWNKLQKLILKFYKKNKINP